MNIAVISSSDDFNTNVIFNKIYRDDCLFYLRLIKIEIEKKGWSFNAVNEVDASKTDILIVFRVDSNIGRILRIIKENTAVKIIHVMHEPPLIVPMHDLSIVEKMPFDLQYALNDDMADRSRVVRKICYGVTPISVEDIPSVKFSEKKFITTIAGAKFSNKRNELYSERVKAIMFFLKKPTGFDLYGVGWSGCENRDIRNVYLGSVDNKKNVLKNYKFALCFENTRGYRGYVTEKIFDCFAAGTVPIYYGAPNIEKYVPKECFIDFRDFDNYERLYTFLYEMTELEYQAFLDAAKVYIVTDKYRKNNAYGYTDTLMSGLDEIAHKVLKRSALGLRVVLILNVIQNMMFYLKNFKSCRRFLFDLVTAW